MRGTVPGRSRSYTERPYVRHTGRDVAQELARIRAAAAAVAGLDEYPAEQIRAGEIAERARSVVDTDPL